MSEHGWDFRATVNGIVFAENECQALSEVQELLHHIDTYLMCWVDIDYVKNIDDPDDTEE